MTEKEKQKKWVKEVWGIILNKFVSAETSEEVNKIFSIFITESEKKLILKRCAIGILLEKGKTYREISNKLKVSFSTIKSVKESINKKNYISRRIYDERSKDIKENIKIPEKGIFESLDIPSPPSISDKNKWEFLDEL